MKRFLAFTVLALCCISGFSQEYLPEWTEGCFDIYGIATGKGENTFMIFPDGTTMLIDCGDMSGGNWNGVAVPDASKTPARWVAGFIEHFAHTKDVDYFLNSHFHQDHFGNTTAMKEFKNGYGLAGVMELGEYVRFGKIIDRGYPGYDFPRDLRKDGTTGAVGNYIKFVEWQVANNGVKAEKIAVGSKKQVSLLKNPRSFRNFEVWNVAANCEVTTGRGSRTRRMNTADPKTFDENMFSIVQIYSYGKFKYYSGGDIPGGNWNQYDGKFDRDFESKVADAIGTTVNVVKSDHHGCQDTNNAYFLFKLRPDAFIFSCSEAKHPWKETVARITDKRIPCGKLLFPTQYTGRDNLGSELQARLQPAGHVVVRVYPGGDSYQIFVLDSTSTDYHVIYKTEIFKL